MCVDITLAEGFINEKKKEYFAWGHRKMFGKNSLKKKKSEQIKVNTVT